MTGRLEQGMGSEAKCFHRACPMRPHPHSVTTVLYEELVSHPRPVAGRVLAACGLEWEEGVMAFHTAQRPVQTASVAQVWLALVLPPVAGLAWGVCVCELQRPCLVSRVRRTHAAGLVYTSARFFRCMRLSACSKVLCTG